MASLSTENPRSVETRAESPARPRQGEQKDHQGRRRAWRSRNNHEIRRRTAGSLPRETRRRGSRDAIKLVRSGGCETQFTRSAAQKSIGPEGHAAMRPGRHWRLLPNSPRALRRHFFRGHERGNLLDRVQMIDARLVGLDRDSKVVFQKSDQLERADRIENASRDQLGLSPSARLGSSPGRNSLQNEIMNDHRDLVHAGLLSLPLVRSPVENRGLRPS